MIARDGMPLLIVIGLVIVGLLILSIWCQYWLLWILFTLALLLFCFTLFFLRDPERHFVGSDKAILAPADGTVIQIVEEEESTYLKQKARKISIFMSVFNVHVNRIPFDGKVEYLHYQKGQFLAAFNNRASEKNEQQAIGIKTEHGKILFKQIAGLIARRIICKLHVGQRVQRGQRFGMIRFGSRVDIYLPLECEVKVKLNQKTMAGETVIGEFIK